MPDREKVIKAIDDCVFHKTDCVGCSYDGCFFEHGDCKRDLLADALELLKEQEAVVRCKDCKHYMTIHCTCDGCCISPDWFCADGKRKEGGEAE